MWCRAEGTSFVPDPGSHPVLLFLSSDSHAQVDSNVILTKSGKIVDFQTTSEGEPYEYEDMLKLFDTAKKGINKIIKMY